MISAFGIIITVAYDDALDRDTLFVFFSFSLSRSVSFAGSERDSTRVRILHSTTLRTKLIKPAIIYIYIYIYIYLFGLSLLLFAKTVVLFIRRFQFTGDDQNLPALNVPLCRKAIYSGSLSCG